MKRFRFFKFEDFKTVRLFRGLNLFAQIILAVLLVGGLNYLAALPAFQMRWDLDDSKSHTLSLESGMFLESLVKKAPADTTADNPWIRVIVTFPESSAGDSREDAYVKNMMRRRIVGLVDNFKYKANSLGIPGFIRFEETDLQKNTRLAVEIEKKNTTGASQISDRTAIVVLSRTRCSTIASGDLLKIKRDDANNPNDVDAFRGEEALMSAILKVADNTVPVVYSLIGEGEAAVDGTDRRFGLSSFASQLRARQIKLVPLDLSRYEDVPADASMLLIANPRISVSRRNEEKIARYLRERNGRVLLLTGPGTQPGLDDLLFDWGIQVMDNFVVETDASKLQYNGNVSMSLIGSEPHKLSEILAIQKIPLVASQFREVRKDIGAQEDATRKITQLVFSSNGVSGEVPSSWGERDYRVPPYAYNENRGDIPGPVCVAVASERIAGMRLGFAIPGGRLVVIGAGDLAANAQIENGGNKAFLLNIVNWLVDRDIYLNIPPRPISDFNLNVSMPDLMRVAWAFAIVPAGTVFLGLIVAFWRRRN